jgi:hypothetical protein
MLISPAWGHGLARAEHAGGGTALLIILAGVIGFYFIYRARKRSRRSEPQHDDNATE